MTGTTFPEAVGTTETTADTVLRAPVVRAAGTSIVTISAAASGTVLPPKDEVGQPTRTTSPPVERIYPHIFDTSESAGRAVALASQAHRDAESALVAFGVGDLEAVGTRLAQVAASCAEAHKLTRFNESFGAVLTYLRRATMTSSGPDVSREALNALVFTLQQITLNPMIDLSDAADYTTSLSKVGWHGEHPDIEKLIAALFDNDEGPTSDAVKKVEATHSS